MYYVFIHFRQLSSQLLKEALVVLNIAYTPSRSEPSPPAVILTSYSEAPSARTPAIPLRFSAGRVPSEVPQTNAGSFEFDDLNRIYITI